MSQGYRRGFTAAEKPELWDLWQRGKSLKARLGERLVSHHRLFISSWHHTGDSSCATAPLEVGIDALGARGDIQRHCRVSIDTIDG
jgi:hypothetical protein